MIDKDIRGIMEAYGQVHSGPDQLDEANQSDLGSRTGRALSNTVSDLLKYGNREASQRQAQRWSNVGKFLTTGQMPGSSEVKRSQSSAAKPSETPAQREARISKAQDAAIAAADKSEKLTAQKKQQSSGSSSSGSSSSGSGGGTLPKPAASSTVLAKQGGVEGKLDKSTGKFTASKFSDAETSRYASVAAKNAPSAAPKPSLGGAERRTPTSAELKAAQDARDTAKASGQSKPDVEKAAVKAGVDTANMSKTFTAKPIPAVSALRPTTPTVFNSTPTSAPKPSAPKPTPTPTTPDTGRSALMKNQLKQDLDIFDIVKGHLLDEGYAETEESAMVIMTNMSEEWRESILDENRMASRMGKMSSPPAKVGKATHSIKDLAPSKEPTPEEKAKARKALGLGEAKQPFPHKKVDRQVYDAMDSGETAGDSGDSAKEKKDYGRAEKMRSVAAKHGGKTRVKEGLDPVGQEDDDVDNDGKKNTKSDKYLKNRRKVVGAAIQKEELEAWVDQLIAEGYDLSEYTWEEVAEIYAEELELAESGKNDARIRGNIKSFGSNYTPPRDWDQSANRGQGAVLNAKQKEKQRRKSLRQEELELGENRRMAADPEGRKSGYSKQPDPSKEGFTGIGNMSIKQIMAMNKKIAAKKKED